jgi:hypothetical protein
MFRNVPATFWQDLAGAIALCILVLATLHLPLFA